MASFDDPEREMTLGEQLRDHIKKAKQQAYYCSVTERKAQPPVIQEIVLARRHLEDAMDRFKRAHHLVLETEED
jgi:hypothetical protein